MTKIFHWVFGSFFRTLGRILCYLIIAVILALILSNAKLPKVSDIFNDIFFMHVNAATFTQEIKQNGTNYLNINSYDGFSIDSEYISKTILYNTNIQTANIVLNTDSANVIKSHDYVQFNYMLGNYGGTTSYDSDIATSHVCKQWVCQSSSSNQQTCICQNYDELDYTLYDMEYTDSSNANNLNISARIDYNGWYSPCTIQENNIICPTYNQSYYKLILNFINNQDNSGGYKIVIPRMYAVLDNVNTANQIIDNQNQNTQSIISNQESLTNQTIQNQNANTNATIENQNQNTQQQIESQQVCTYIDKINAKEDGYLNISGVKINNSVWSLTDYISIDKYTTIKVIDDLTNGVNTYACFYNINKETISCIELKELRANQTITIPEYASYFRSGIFKNSNRPTYNICRNGNQAMANTITDESGPSNISSLSNENMVGWLPPGPVDSLINLPLVLLSSLQNALSSTCSPVTLTLPFVNSDIQLPCMSTLYESMGVSSFVNWAGIVASAFILFSYLLRFYKWVDNTLTFRENNWLDNWGGE